LNARRSAHESSEGAHPFDGRLFPGLTPLESFLVYQGLQHAHFRISRRNCKLW